MRRKSAYKQPAYWTDTHNVKRFIRVYSDERQSISDPMGNSLLLSDGEVYVETDADYVFQIEDGIEIKGYDELSIKQIISRVPRQNDNNAYRGTPVYVTKMIIN